MRRALGVPPDIDTRIETPKPFSTSCVSTASNGKRATDRPLAERIGRLADIALYRKGKKNKIYLKEAEIPIVKQALRDLDKNGDGTLQLDEIDHVRQSDTRCKQLAFSTGIPKDRWEDIFGGCVKLTFESVLRLDDLDSAFEIHRSRLSVFCHTCSNKTKRKIIMIILFFLLGAIVFSNFNEYRSGPDAGEKWTVMDALYFSAASLTTVGYGDLAPSSPEMKAFTCLYVLVGLVLVAGVINEFSRAAMRGYAESMSQLDVGGDETWDVQVRGLGGERLRNNEKRFFAQVVGAIMLFLAPLLLGAITISFLEDWSAGDSLYWAIITITTVGYGDLQLVNQSSRAFAFFYMLIGFVIVGAVVGNAGILVMANEMEAKRIELQERQMTPELLKRMDTDGNGVTELEFLCFCLLEFGKADCSDLEDILKKFAVADQSGDGVLTAADLEGMEWPTSVRLDRLPTMKIPLSHGKKVVVHRKLVR